MRELSDCASECHRVAGQVQGGTRAMNLRAVIADDEPLATRRLASLLEAIEGVDLVGVAEDGKSAIHIVETVRPNLLLLDILMPELNGFEVLRAIGPSDRLATIFVTAHEGFAVDAIAEGAVDYVLKPAELDRVVEACDRARGYLKGKADEERIARLDAALASLRSRSPLTRTSRWESEIWVDKRGHLQRLEIDEIDWITSDGDYVVVHVGEDRFMIRDRISSLAERLDPERFMRVHRSSIIMLERVTAIEKGKFGSITMVLRSGHKVRVSKPYRSGVLRRIRQNDRSE